MACTTPYPLPSVRPRWRTPDAAIREAVMHSPLRARGIDYARIPGTGDERAAAIDAHSRVWAVLAQLDRRERAVIIGRALMLSYEEIAAFAEEQGVRGLSRSSAHRLAREVWPRVRDRLVELGLVDA